MLILAVVTDRQNHSVLKIRKHFVFFRDIVFVMRFVKCFSLRTRRGLRISGWRQINIYSIRTRPGTDYSADVPPSARCESSVFLGRLPPPYEITLGGESIVWSIRNPAWLNGQLLTSYWPDPSTEPNRRHCCSLLPAVLLW